MGMRSRWQRVADWCEEDLIPFAHDHPLAGWLAAFAAVIAGNALWLLVEDGSQAALRLLRLFALCFGWIYVLALAWWAPGWEMERRRRQVESLRAKHICLHCGYDIRATPDRCPECGK